MYVVRLQCFIPIITLFRNAAMNALMHKHFDKAIDEIDKTMSHLEKVKKELLGSDNQLRIANGKVDDVSIKRLTKNNSTMRAKFEELKEG